MRSGAQPGNRTPSLFPSPPGSRIFSDRFKRLFFAAISQLLVSTYCLHRLAWRCGGSITLALVGIFRTHLGLDWDQASRIFGITWNSERKEDLARNVSLLVQHM